MGDPLPTFILNVPTSDTSSSAVVAYPLNVRLGPRVPARPWLPRHRSTNERCAGVKNQSVFLAAVTKEIPIPQLPRAQRADLANKRDFRHLARRYAAPLPGNILRVETI